MQRLYVNPTTSDLQMQGWRHPTTSDLRAQTTLSAWVATPGYIWDQIRALDTEYTSVNKELSRQTIDVKMYRFLADVWDPLRKAWSSFVSDHRSWYNRLWGSTVDVIDEYRQRLQDFRVQAKSVGFSFDSPEPRERSASGWTSAGKIVKFAVVGGIVIGGIFVLYKVLPAGRQR